jgi:hypothetical protein
MAKNDGDCTLEPSWDIDKAIDVFDSLNLI